MIHNTKTQSQNITEKTPAGPNIGIMDKQLAFRQMEGRIVYLSTCVCVSV